MEILMKRNNLFLAAFVAVLVKCLMVGFSGPAIGAMGVILALIGFQDHLEVNRIKEEFKPLSEEIKKLRQEIEKHKKLQDDQLEKFGAEVNIRVTKIENISKMNSFQIKK